MKTFYITFGRTGIRNGYVRVLAYDENIVRAWAMHEYGRLWSSVYDQESWDETRDENPEFYPAGELAEVKVGYQQADHVPAPSDA